MKRTESKRDRTHYPAGTNPSTVHHRPEPPMGQALEEAMREAEQGPRPSDHIEQNSWAESDRARLENVGKG